MGVGRNPYKAREPMKAGRGGHSQKYQGIEGGGAVRKEPRVNRWRGYPGESPSTRARLLGNH
jgi:hypothetical protein